MRTLTSSSAAAVGKRKQRRPAGHDRQAGRVARRRRCCSTSAAVGGDIGGGQARLRIGRGDPRFRGLDCLGRSSLLRAQALRLILRIRRHLLEPCRLGVRGRLLGPGGLQLVVERLTGILGQRASRKQRQSAK